MDYLNNFKERLSELIFDEGINVEQLSLKLNYPKSEIYHWIAGDYMPSLQNLILLADYFSCTIDFLIGKEDEKRIVKIKKCAEFSIYIRQVVKNSGSNFNKIMKATNISSSTIHYWKTGKHEPQLDNLIKIANFLNCSIDYLIGRE